MTTLAELLALLPDNTTGEISAEDMRTVVSGIWDEFATGFAVNDGRISALENSGAATGPSVTGIWQINPQAGAVPGGMQITSDTGEITLATSWLRFAKADQSNTDFTGALLASKALYGQQQVKSANWVKATVLSATDEGSYVEVEVNIIAQAGDSTVGWQTATVVISL